MDKDQSLHRLLERTSRARADARPQGACLDAETLAAWMDDSLTAAERTAAETHVADCERCLSVLAAIAKTSPPPSAIQPPSWLSVRWLVPLTTAAVAITAWVLVQRPPDSGRPVAPPPPPIAAVNPAEPPLKSERDASSAAPADAQEKQTASPQSSALFRDRAQSRRSADSAAKGSSGKPGAFGETPAPVQQTRKTAPPAATASQPAQPPSRAEALEERVQVLARALSLPRIIVSPDPDRQWRIAGPSLERTTDGGRTWRAQATGTAVDLFAGASPAPAVCWMVGRKGTVLLSTDGETWRRLDFPDASVDLVGVTARDGVDATVRTADRRTYRTIDGGRTWTLQENPATPF